MKKITTLIIMILIVGIVCAAPYIAEIETMSNGDLNSTYTFNSATDYLFTNISLYERMIIFNPFLSYHNILFNVTKNFNVNDASAYNTSFSDVSDLPGTVDPCLTNCSVATIGNILRFMVVDDNLGDTCMVSNYKINFSEGLMINYTMNISYVSNSIYTHLWITNNTINTSINTGGDIDSYFALSSTGVASGGGEVRNRTHTIESQVGLPAFSDLFLNVSLYLNKTDYILMVNGTITSNGKHTLDYDSAYIVFHAESDGTSNFYELENLVIRDDPHIHPTNLTIMSENRLLYNNNSVFDQDTIIALNESVLNDLIDNCTYLVDNTCLLTLNISNAVPSKLSLSPNITFLPYEMDYTQGNLAETSFTSFNFYLSNYSTSASNANLVYNGSYYTLTKTTYPTYTEYNTTFYIPITDYTNLIFNNSFYFNYNYTNSSVNDSYTSLTYNQTIYQLILDNCTTVSTHSLNISLWNLTTDTAYTDFADYAIDYWLGTEDLKKNVSGTFYGHSFLLCMYPNWTSIIGSGLIEFATDVYFDYSLYQYNFSNATSQLKLYTQDATSQVLFTVEDRSSDPVEDAYIHVLKYEVDSNSYITTEIIKTDSQGQGLGNIVLGTTFYNFLIYYQGTLIYSELGVKLISTTRTFTVTLEEDDWYEQFDTALNLHHSLTFNNVTNNFVFTWTDPTSRMHYACLKVEMSNATSYSTLSDECQESASGTILYTIPPSIQGSSFTATSYLKFDALSVLAILQKIHDASYSWFNITPKFATFIGFLFTLTLFMIGIPMPILSLILLIVGVFISSLLGFFAITIQGVIVILAVILIQIFLKSRR